MEFRRDFVRPVNGQIEHFLLMKRHDRDADFDRQPLRLHRSCDRLYLQAVADPGAQFPNEVGHGGTCSQAHGHAGLHFVQRGHGCLVLQWNHSSGSPPKIQEPVHIGQVAFVLNPEGVAALIHHFEVPFRV